MLFLEVSVLYQSYPKVKIKLLWFYCSNHKSCDYFEAVVVGAVVALDLVSSLLYSL